MNVRHIIMMGQGELQDPPYDHGLIATLLHKHFTSGA
jgi:hypothetical protein